MTIQTSIWDQIPNVDLQPRRPQLYLTTEPISVIGEPTEPLLVVGEPVLVEVPPHDSSFSGNPLFFSFGWSEGESL